MNRRKSTKETITEIILNELPTSIKEHTEDNIEKLLTVWWITGRHDGLRLTDEGDLHFRMAEIEFFDFDLAADLVQNKNSHSDWHKFLLDCNKKIQCPYYFGVYKKLEGDKKLAYIRLYDSKVAMMVQLYGSIKEYLDSIKVKR